MNIFNQLGGKPNQMGQPQNMNQFMQMFQQFQQNPVKFLNQAGFNIPPELQNNPNGMIEYIRNSGRVSNEQNSQINQMANNAMQFMPRK